MIKKITKEIECCQYCGKEFPEGEYLPTSQACANHEKLCKEFDSLAPRLRVGDIFAPHGLQTMIVDEIVKDYNDRTCVYKCRAFDLYSMAPDGGTMEFDQDAISVVFDKEKLQSTHDIVKKMLVSCASSIPDDCNYSVSLECGRLFSLTFKFPLCGED